MERLAMLKTEIFTTRDSKNFHVLPMTPFVEVVEGLIRAHWTTGKRLTNYSPKLIVDTPHA